MARVGVVSYRLGGVDGVSVEAAKWCGALAALGHEVTTVAGEGTAEHLVAGLAARATGPVDGRALERALAGCDLVVVENLVSLPLNPHAVEATYRALAGRAALFRHHDLAWQRPGGPDAPPRTGDRWRHVTINERSRVELAARGVAALTLYNAFDLDPPVGERHGTRARLGVGDGRLALMPSRAIARKNVPGALALCEALGATLWILGPAEDGYDDELDRLVAAGAAPVIRGRPEGVDVADAYAACDLVIVASTWEGFGNPVLESVAHRRPLAVNPYPVLTEITATGLRFFELTDVEAIAAELDAPDLTRRAANLALARAHFDLADLPHRLAPLVGELLAGSR
ncbi:MAG TPA: glycosyltransferase family 4 protein [Acidimicrobiales bacterium]|nr:glycosyltransferase family 4 protein [Acidimicrobiales bacterium]